MLLSAGPDKTAATDKSAIMVQPREQSIIMIKILGRIPRSCCVAVSGGVDSMAVLDFLRRSHDVIVLHYNHGTEFANHAEEVVKKYCQSYDIQLFVGRLGCEVMPAGVSKEAWWRDKRYNFFDHTFANHLDNRPIITCHHLEDAVENWVFTSMHGNPALIPYRREKYLRPFLTTRKSEFYSWCERKNVPWVTDPSNTNIAFRRNYIRHKMIEHALMINPGIHKTIKKKYNKEQ